MEPDINIISKEETDEGWDFIVEIKDSAAVTQHTISIDEEYFDTFSFEEPEELLRSSILFLLDHETPDQILPAFNVHVIADYFPEFEDTVESYLDK